MACLDALSLHECVCVWSLVPAPSSTVNCSVVRVDPVELEGVLSELGSPPHVTLMLRSIHNTLRYRLQLSCNHRYTKCTSSSL